MRPLKINDIELLERLMSVLREKGYDGATLNDLASASGLQKASLYHRFPGGKKDIGLAVLNFVETWKEENINQVIANKEYSPKQRLSTILKNLNVIYDQGKCSCVMRALSMGDGLELFGHELKQGAESWLASLTALGLDFGFDQQVAATKAMQAIVMVQGSLVVAKNLNSTEPFALALKEITALYLEE